MMAPVLKTGVGASPPWVRIPPRPPLFYKALIIKETVEVFDRAGGVAIPVRFEMGDAGLLIRIGKMSVFQTDQARLEPR